MKIQRFLVFSVDFDLRSGVQHPNAGRNIQQWLNLKLTDLVNYPLLYISTRVRVLRPRTQVEINGKRRKTLNFHWNFIDFSENSSKKNLKREGEREREERVRVVYFDQCSGAAPPNAGRNWRKTPENAGISLILVKIQRKKPVFSI